MTNADVAWQFRQLAALLELQGANPFRVNAYRNAARTAETWPEPLEDIARGGLAALKALPGVGHDLASRILEIATTGSFDLLRQESAKVPVGLPTLLRIPGLGPRKVKALHAALGIASLGDLREAVEAKRITGVPGFGPATVAKLERDLAAFDETKERVLRADAVDEVEPLLAYLRVVKGIMRVEPVGSYRRHRDTVGDFDFVAIGDGAALDAFTAYPPVAEVIARHAETASIRLASGMRANLWLAPEASFGACLLQLTGSQAHTERLRQLAVLQDMTLDGRGLFKGGALVASRTEEDIARCLRLPFIPPELREGRGEIEAALRGTLPARLLELGDLKGDLQMHTTASDGRDSLEKMAAACEAKGYAYIGITDHSPMLKMIKGLDAAAYRAQWRAIDALNAKLRTLTVLKSGEVDILPDGSLDMDDDTLREMDVVVVSLHSALRLPPAEQTARVVRALRHPSVDIMGHPTGRIISRREGAGFNMKEVCRVAADHGVLLEVNASPDRLDLTDTAVRIALEAGVRLVVSTDAHSTRELEFMHWGVDQARRGWATRDDVANTRPLKQFLELMHRNR